MDSVRMALSSAVADLAPPEPLFVTTESRLAYLRWLGTMSERLRRSKPDWEVRRDENSWLIDGVTPIEDVLHALQLDALPHAEEYETLAGFLMVMLRRVPRRTDSVLWGGYKFEVLDVDSYRIDQVMVSRLLTAPAENGAQAEAARS